MASFNQILNISRTGMLTTMMDFEVVSNNLANVNSSGFKASRSNFQELLAQHQLNGVQISSIQSSMDQGSLKTTENALDLAIQGPGFFAVALPDGRTAYTRDGAFSLDANRQIVNANGYKLNWEGEIPDGVENIHINPNGTVMVQQSGIWTQVGAVQINRFPNPLALLGYGQDLWLESEASGAALSGTPNSQGYGSIYGNVLEESNVDMGDQMVQMVNLQRSFQMSLRTFQQTDQMFSQAIHMRKG